MKGSMAQGEQKGPSQPYDVVSFCLAQGSINSKLYGVSSSTLSNFSSSGKALISVINWVTMLDLKYCCCLLHPQNAQFGLFTHH